MASQTAKAGPAGRIGLDRVAQRYSSVRAFTERLCEPLCIEDFVIQTMPDASPTRWHLAHTSWFFETFILRTRDAGYRPLNAQYHYLFNSYYNTVGEQWPRPRRGLLSRPTVQEVFEYRHHVDEHMLALIHTLDPDGDRDLIAAIELGVHHEQQHQELILTDIKHVFSTNPLSPVYRAQVVVPGKPAGDMGWKSFDEGLYEVGFGDGGFAFDNEKPRHRVFVEAFQLATRPVSNGEYLEFIEAGGYRTPELWLSDAWLVVPVQRWEAPLHWVRRDGGWRLFTLGGMQSLQPDEPVSHLSYYEADAYARWRDARIPTEAEWEIAAATMPVEGNFVESGRYHPVAAPGSALRQMYGDVWEWTSSPYTAYPGYRNPTGAFGEYNGKFMCDQFVLRGGSCATPVRHMRRTYRNFFPAAARWQFSGLRLARDA